MRAHVTEYYRVNDCPVVVVMTPDRVGIQAYYADLERNALIGQRNLMVDIRDHNHQGQVSEGFYRAFCAHHNIDPEIPEDSLKRSFRLAELTGSGIKIPEGLSVINSNNNNNTRQQPTFSPILS